MKKLCKLLTVLAVAGGLAACDKEPGKTDTRVREEFSSATNISTTLAGSVLGIPTAGKITEYGFLVSGNEPFDNAEAIAYAAEDVKIERGDANFSCRITGLVPNTTYYFKLYYVMDGEMIVEESINEFKTKNYLMFTCLDGNLELALDASDGTKVRTDWLFSVDGEILKDYGEGQKISLTKGHTVQFVYKYAQDKNNPGMNLSNSEERHAFVATGDGHLSVSGDLTSLVSSENCYGADFKIPERTFHALFRDCTALVDAGELIFPEVAELGKDCYCEMFSGCTNLVRAPGSIPGKTAGEGCCDLMFYSCTSLVSAPELPATTVASRAYHSMFKNCESLEKAPKIAGTSFGTSSCHSMFFGCKNLTVAPEFHEATLSSSCFAYMFNKCTKLTASPYLPSKYLADNCYAYMFSDCSGLISARKIDAIRMAEQSCSYMFANCAGLTSAPDLPAMILAENCYEHMFYYCSSLTSAPALPATNLAWGCYQSMFDGCSSLMKAPDLVAPKMVDHCYGGMFMNCGKINKIKIYATIAPTVGNCFYNMAEGTAADGDVYVKNGEILGWFLEFAGGNVKNWKQNYF